MKVTGIDSVEKKIAVEMDMTEAGHLMTFLLHAKFSDDIRLEIVGSPTMQALLSGLIRSALDLGETKGWPNGPEGWDIREEDGLRAPPVFSEIEKRLKALRGDDYVEQDLKEWLYPFVWQKTAQKGSF